MGNEMIGEPQLKSFLGYSEGNGSFLLAGLEKNPK